MGEDLGTFFRGRTGFSHARQVNEKLAADSDPHPRSGIVRSTLALSVARGSRCRSRLGTGLGYGGCGILLAAGVVRLQLADDQCRPASTSDQADRRGQPGTPR